MIYLEHGSLAQATSSICRAIQLNGGQEHYHNSLLTALTRENWTDSRLLDDVISVCRQEIKMREDSAVVWDNLGGALLMARRGPEAALAFRKTNRATAKCLYMRHLERLLTIDDVTEHDRILEEMIALILDDADLETARMFRLNFDENQDPKDLSGKYQQWSEKHFGSIYPNSPMPIPSISDRKIRIAYIGSYLHLMFMPNIIHFHDNDRFELFLDTDDTRIDFKKYNSDLIVSPLKGVDLVASCRERGIDIAIDLVGPFPYWGCLSQFAAFQERLAPIQCLWIGMVNTTGSRAIDYVIADWQALNSQVENLFPERTPAFRMSLIAGAPPVTLPIPDRCPLAKFHFKGRHAEDSEFTNRVFTIFAERGISSERILFSPHGEHLEFFDFFHEIDVTLDTHPYIWRSHLAGGAVDGNTDRRSQGKIFCLARDGEFSHVYRQGVLDR